MIIRDSPAEEKRLDCIGKPKPLLLVVLELITRPGDQVAAVAFIGKVVTDVFVTDTAKRLSKTLRRIPRPNNKYAIPDLLRDLSDKLS